jgi:hypothetical protein
MVLNYIWIAFFIIAFIIFPVAGSMQVVCYRWQDNRVYIGLPCRLTATATLMLPDGFFLLRIYMGAKVQKIADSPKFTHQISATDDFQPVLFDGVEG